jgi:large subunit ribosomal protein L18
MEASKNRRVARTRRRARVRRKISGTDTQPRLTVFRSNRHLYVQVISDESGRTLASVSSFKELGGGSTVEKAKELGKQIAQKCSGLGIEDVVFDRSGYKYHGRVKAIGDAAREAGLKF